MNKESEEQARKVAAAILGRKGGQAKTEKKAAASRRNGAKGGRPRKTPPDGQKGVKNAFSRQDGESIPDGPENAK